MAHSLEPEDKLELSASLVESQQMLTRAERRNRTTMKTAQTAPAMPGMPPKQSQAAPVPPVPAPGPGMMAPEAQMAPAPGAPPAMMTPEAQMLPGQEPLGAPPAGPPGMEAGGGEIEDFIEEDKEGQADPMTGPEMGIKPGMDGAKFARLYGHLRIRAHAQGVEVFDPTNNNRGLFVARLKQNVRANRTLAFQAARKILSGIAAEGVAATARRCGSRVAESVADQAGFSQTEKPDGGPGTVLPEDGTLSQGEQPGPGQTSILADGVWSQTEKPSSKKANRGGWPRRAGVDDGGGPAMSPAPGPTPDSAVGGSPLAAAEQPDANPDTALDDAVGPFLAKGAQFDDSDFAMKPEDGEEGVTASIDELAERFRLFYARKAAQDTKTAIKLYNRRLARCLALAVQRQASNIDRPLLKAAMADSLMREGYLGREAYVPLDDRTATYTIERGLDRKAHMQFLNSIFKRAAQFMGAGDEALMQMESDAKMSQTVAPSDPSMDLDGPMDAVAQAAEGMPGMPQDPGMAAEGQMGPGMMGPGMAPEGQMDPLHDPALEDPDAADPIAAPMDPMQAAAARGAAMRAQAQAGNPMARAASVDSQVGGKRDGIRAALSRSDGHRIAGLLGRGLAR